MHLAELGRRYEAPPKRDQAQPRLWQVQVAVLLTALGVGGLSRIDDSLGSVTLARLAAWLPQRFSQSAGHLVARPKLASVSVGHS